MPSLNNLLRVRSQQVEALLRACDEALRQTTVVPDLDRFALEIELVHGARRTSLAALMDDAPLIVLHGPPGCGKTITLLKTLKQMATRLRQTLGERRTSSGAGQLPIYVDSARAEGTALPDLFVHQLLMHGEALALLARILGQFELVLLLDGLNELPKAVRRRTLNELVNLVSALKARHLPFEVRVLLTTRTYLLGDELEYLKRAGFTLAEVAPIDGPRIEREFGRALGISNTRARALLEKVDPQARALLSTAQNLDCIVHWCKSKGERADNFMNSVRTRGALLDHCIRARLPDSLHPLTVAALAMLGRLAYDLPPGETRFSRRDAVRAAQETAELLGLADHIPLLDLVFELRLLTEVVDDVCRFDHHSHQQYFLGREMAHRPSEWRRYISEGVWHEPLVLMAGTLVRSQQATLLKMADGDRPLYAYLLANIDWHERQRTFLSDTAESFHRDVRRIATGLARHLKALTLLWMLLLPISLLTVAVVEGAARTFLTAGIPLLILAPFIVVRWHRARLTARLSGLRHVQLPDLLAVNRPFRERGMLKKVSAGLEQMILSLQRSRYSNDDPRIRFLTHAVAVVHEALETTTALSEDEILSQLTDPLVEQVLEPTEVSEHGVDRLTAYATRDAEQVAVRLRAIRLLGRIWLARPEFREKIESVLVSLVADRRQARSIRRIAADTCRETGVRAGHYRQWPNLRQALGVVTIWLRRLLAHRA